VAENFTPAMLVQSSKTGLRLCQWQIVATTLHYSDIISATEEM
jgi:hypothetical protein